MSLEIITKALEEHGGAVKELKTHLSQELASVKEHQQLLEKELIEQRRPGRGKSLHMDSPGRLVKEFAGSEQFDMLLKGAPSTGRVQLSDISLKALTNAGAGGEGTTGFDVQPQRLDGIYNDPRRALTLLGVLPSLRVGVSKFEYIQLDGYANAAAFQEKEGDAKAEASMPTEVTEASVATIAHWTRASVQVLDDAPSLSQQIGSLLAYGLLAKLEAALVAGTGGQGKINGLLNQATAFTAQGALADVVGAAITELGANGWAPGLVVMNPNDWYSITSERADGGDGQYILGSPRDPAPPSLWGVPVVTTPSITAGTVLVLDPSQVAILDRMSPTLMASRHDGSNFTSNLVTILAEMRAGLAVFATGAVLKVTVGSGT